MNDESPNVTSLRKRVKGAHDALLIADADIRGALEATLNAVAQAEARATALQKQGDEREARHKQHLNELLAARQAFLDDLRVELSRVIDCLPNDGGGVAEGLLEDIIAKLPQAPK